jgi:hypothetical protein
MKSYLIEARLKYPSIGHDGYDFTVIAATKADAIKRARREIIDHGHHGRVDGPISYRAIELAR